MKKAILFIIAALIFAACKTTKHAERSTIRLNVDSSFVGQKTTDFGRIFVNTTKTETGEIVITEIEFAEPGLALDHDSAVTGTIATSADIEGIGKVVGVKRIRKTSVIKTKTENGRSEKDTASVQEKQTGNVSRQVAAKEVKTDTQKTIPIKYILFAMAIIAVVAFLVWKRKDIKNIWAKILSILWRIG